MQKNFLKIFFYLVIFIGCPRHGIQIRDAEAASVLSHLSWQFGKMVNFIKQVLQNCSSFLSQFLWWGENLRERENLFSRKSGPDFRQKIRPTRKIMKGSLISEGILTLVPLPTKGAKFLPLAESLIFPPFTVNNWWEIWDPFFGNGKKSNYFLRLSHL